MKIGPYEVMPMEVGRFALDGGAMFGVVPKTLWSRQHPADESNRISLSLRVLLLQSEDRLILIDTGLGDKFSEKEADMYGLQPEAGNLFSALSSRGIQPEEITDVILTHLHFDHAGGATRLNKEKLEPSFTNAQYWIQKRNWDWAQNPSEKDRASYLQENFVPLHEQSCLTFLEGEGEILPNIFTWVSDGHTIGQQLIKIQDDTTTLIYCADIIPTASHIRLPYIMGYDLHPMTTLEEKRSILKQAHESNWILIFEHDPKIAACTIQKNPKGYEMGEIIDFSKH